VSRADFDAVAADAAAYGLDACAWLPVARLDRALAGRVAALRRDCRTVLLLGHGGGEFWRQLVAESGVPRADPSRHPLAARARRIAADLLARHRLHGSVHGPDDAPPLDFVTLAERAGLGYRSPVLGLLLHRVHGPWLGLRAALLLDGQPFGAWREPARDFAPCIGCARPCLRACPVGVYDGSGGGDFTRCWAHRQVDACARGCAVRRACPVGRPPDEAEEAFRHAYSTFALGAWVARQPI
jgi:hypothetical protein